jgi:hypothetical protein
MAFLKERIHRATCRSDRRSVFTALVSKLRSENFHIEKEDSSKGEIVVRCESLPVNWVLWRCWSGKLLFEVREAEDGKTAIDVYALPDLFRIRGRKSEPTDPRLILSRLALEEL